MTIQTNYVRGDGGVTLTAQQQAQLNLLFQTQQQLASGNSQGHRPAITSVFKLAG